MKKTILILAALMLLCVSGPVFATDSYPDESMNMFMDAVLVRPVSLASVIVGTAVFIVALPFSIPSGTVQKTGRVFVADPFGYTFYRRIGDFENHDNADNYMRIPESD